MHSGAIIINRIHSILYDTKFGTFKPPTQKFDIKNYFSCMTMGMFFFPVEHASHACLPACKPSSLLLGIRTTKATSSEELQNVTSDAPREIQYNYVTVHSLIFHYSI